MFIKEGKVSRKKLGYCENTDINERILGTEGSMYIVQYVCG
jgi:hypothetical protein